MGWGLLLAVFAGYDSHFLATMLVSSLSFEVTKQIYVPKAWVSKTREYESPEGFSEGSSKGPVGLRAFRVTAQTPLALRVGTTGWPRGWPGSPRLPLGAAARCCVGGFGKAGSLPKWSRSPQPCRAPWR